jgi:hypothetical protein
MGSGWLHSFFPPINRSSSHLSEHTFLSHQSIFIIHLETLGNWHRPNILGAIFNSSFSIFCSFIFLFIYLFIYLFLTICFYQFNRYNNYFPAISHIPGCCIGPNVCIGANVKLEAGVRLLDSTILPDTAVQAHSYIAHSIVGRKCVIGKCGDGNFMNKLEIK